MRAFALRHQHNAYAVTGMRCRAERLTTAQGLIIGMRTDNQNTVSGDQRVYRYKGGSFRAVQH